MKTLLPIPALLFALHANAACYMPIPETAMPAIPDGASATEASMVEAQAAVKTYVSDIEAYLDCRSGDLSALEHNNLVYNVTLAARSYNAALSEFRAQQEAVAGR